MSQRSAAELNTLVWSLYEQPSIFDRWRGVDHRHPILAEVVASGTISVVPHPLALLPTAGSLARDVGKAISELVQGITPAELCWLDDEVRHSSDWSYWPGAWHNLRAEDIRRLAWAVDLDLSVIGLLASHHNGFVVERVYARVKVGHADFSIGIGWRCE